MFFRPEIILSGVDIKQQMVNKHKHSCRYHHFSNFSNCIKYAWIYLRISQPEAGDLPGVHLTGAPKGQPHNLRDLEENTNHKDHRDLEEKM